MSIKITRCFVLDRDNTLAYFDFEYAGLLFRDWQLRNGRNGEFVSSPSKEVEGDPKPFFVNYVSVPKRGEEFDEKGQQVMDAILNAALESYEAGGTQQESRGRGNGGGRGSNRGGGGYNRGGGNRGGGSRGGGRGRSGGRTSRPAARSGRGPTRQSDEGGAPFDADDDDLPF